jgi:hypothetical protein
MIKEEASQLGLDNEGITVLTNVRNSTIVTESHPGRPKILKQYICAPFEQKIQI